MAELTLVIANRNYSSWSLRAWLALRRTGQPFREVVVPLRQADTGPRILEHSPSGRVPVLRHKELVVWDSLAICEYLAEAFPEASLWPREAVARAVARAVCAEMHAGFAVLRSSLPMCIRRRTPAPERVAAARWDVERILGMWRDCRRQYGAGGPFLFGEFSIADAFYAPVVTRFRSWGVALEGPAAAYADAVWSMPDLAAWVRAAEAEPWSIPEIDD